MPSSRLNPRLAKELRERLGWSLAFKLVSYTRSTLWVVPFLSIVLVGILGPSLKLVDAWLGWKFTALGVAGATALCNTVITLALSFMVFTFGSLLVAIQVASGQLTPRVIATTLLRDNVVRYSVGLFVFTLVFTVMVLDRLEQQLYGLVVFVVAALGIGCIAGFLFLIDHAARLLRPVSILAKVGQSGLQSIEELYPERTDEQARPYAPATPPAGASRTVFHAGSSGIVLAVAREGLVEMAFNADGVIECVPHIGDFVASGEPIFKLYGGAFALDDAALQGAIAFGAERTMEQDPLFAFRILVDIALKALSPAINDPTTAVLAIDQLHHLLRAVGRRRLRQEWLDDHQGVHRVIYRTPNWEDFVDVACTEIRACGATSVQVMRRMRAMLEELAAALPSHREPALRTELRRLDLTIERNFPLADDLAMARVPDSQGLGTTRATSGAPR